MRTHLNVVSALALILATSAEAQQSRSPDFDPKREWQWSELRNAPGVAGSQVDWLESNLDRADAQKLFRLISDLSSPADAQLLASDVLLETNAAFFRRRIDSLLVRPGAGTAGIVRVAWLAALFRKSTIEGLKQVYPFEFRNRPPVLPRASAQRRNAGIHLEFNTAPAESLLVILSTPDISVDDAMRRTNAPAFEALVQHRSQSFYPVPLTRLRLATYLSKAASTSATDKLYDYMMPMGRFHYVDVATNIDEYRRVVSTLRDNQRQFLDLMEDSLASFLPRDAKFSRVASFFFADGADGWASSAGGGVYGIDLEYFKDDYAKIYGTLLHETFHAGQKAVAGSARPRNRSTWSPLDSAVEQALEQLFVEGTANYVAPAATLPDTAQARLAAKGSQIIDDLLLLGGTSWNAHNADSLLDSGTTGGGPFYWLGAAMSRAIDQQLGRRMLAESQKGDAIDFALTYIRAQQKSERQASVLSNKLLGEIHKLARS